MQTIEKISPFSLPLCIEDISLELLNDSEYELFEYLCREFVSHYYPETEENYARNLFRTQLIGCDTYGLFTLHRQIWSIIYRLKIIGFFTASEKMGGSIKLGPIVIHPAFRRKNLGKKVIKCLEKFYSALGIRKFYMTIPECNSQAVSFAFSAGFNLEAQLKLHYSKDYDELVFGKKILNVNSSLRHEIDNVNYSYRNAIMASYKIDKYFVDRLNSSLCRDIFGDYSKKPRKLFNEHSGHDDYSFVLSAPKRGGAVKLGPICGNPKILKRILIDVERFFFNLEKRKIYALVSALDKEIINQFIESKYRIEGRLTVPYRNKIDMFVLSKNKR